MRGAGEQVADARGDGLATREDLAEVVKDDHAVAQQAPALRRVRRVARWLKECGAAVVSREDIRRKALGQAVNAGDADQVLPGPTVLNAEE